MKISQIFALLRGRLSLRREGGRFMAMAVYKAALEQRLNVIIYPASDLPGQWVAHCLELDLVSQGNNPPQALDMIAEAIEICAHENARENRPPLDYRSAPPEIWERFRRASTTTAKVIKILRIPESQTEIQIAQKVQPKTSSSSYG